MFLYNKCQQKISRGCSFIHFDFFVFSFFLNRHYNFEVFSDICFATDGSIPVNNDITTIEIGLGNDAHSSRKQEAKKGVLIFWPFFL